MVKGCGRSQLLTSWHWEAGQKSSRDRDRYQGHTAMTHPDMPRRVLHQPPEPISEPIKLSYSLTTTPPVVHFLPSNLFLFFTQFQFHVGSYLLSPGRASSAPCSCTQLTGHYQSSRRVKPTHVPMSVVRKIFKHKIFLTMLILTY